MKCTEQWLLSRCAPSKRRSIPGRRNFTASWSGISSLERARRRSRCLRRRRRRRHRSARRRRCLIAWSSPASHGRRRRWRKAARSRASPSARPGRRRPRRGGRRVRRPGRRPRRPRRRGPRRNGPGPARGRGIAPRKESSEKLGMRRSKTGRLVTRRGRRSTTFSLARARRSRVTNTHAPPPPKMFVVTLSSLSIPRRFCEDGHCVKQK